jgi:hypothetical protein
MMAPLEMAGQNSEQSGGGFEHLKKVWTRVLVLAKKDSR